MQYSREVNCIACGATKDEYKEVLFSREGVGETIQFVTYPIKSGIKCCKNETLTYSEWDENKTCSSGRA